MRLILAIFLPFILFFTIGRPLAGIVCFFLGLTDELGYLFAVIWAVYALGQYQKRTKNQRSFRL